MKPFPVLLSALSLLAFSLGGCGWTDEDYKSGQWWLEHEGNWQMAAKAFQRSLDKSPKNWKTHKAMLDALSRGDDAAAMEAEIHAVLIYYPDSGRSALVSGPGTAVLGEQRYKTLAFSQETHHLGEILAKKGDRPELLCRAVMAASWNKDTIAAVDYYQRLLTKLDSPNAPDSVVQEMNFFVGAARVEWLKLGWQVKKSPGDLNARMAQIDAGLILGDMPSVRGALKDMTDHNPDATKNPDVIRRFGILLGQDPFAEHAITPGWDGDLSPDGRQVIYVRDRGKPGQSDQYIFRAGIDGSGETPIMKAAQQFLTSLALPRYSPDGRWIYFYGSPDRNWTPGDLGRFNLYRVSPDYGANPQKLTDADILVTPVHFNSDGTLLIVRRDIGSTRASVELFKLYPDRQRLESLSRIGEPVTGAAFTPSGDSILFITDRGIFRRAVSGGNITVDFNWTGLNFIQMSPDGGSILLNTPTGTALLVDRTTRRPTYLGEAATPLCAFGPGGQILLTRSKDGGRSVVKLHVGG